MINCQKFSKCYFCPKYLLVQYGRLTLHRWRDMADFRFRSLLYFFTLLYGLIVSHGFGGCGMNQGGGGCDATKGTVGAREFARKNLLRWCDEGVRNACRETNNDNRNNKRRVRCIFTDTCTSRIGVWWTAGGERDNLMKVKVRG